MPNGGTPPDRLLRDIDYQMIKGGTLVTSGTYEGCIYVANEERNYWIRPKASDGTYWKLKITEPDEYITKITSEVWAKCKDGGDYEWDSEAKVWRDGSDEYRWAGWAGHDVELRLME